MAHLHLQILRSVNRDDGWFLSGQLSNSADSPSSPCHQLPTPSLSKESSIYLRSLYKYSSLMFIYIALSTVLVQGAEHDKIYPTLLPGIRPGLSNKTYTSKKQPTHPKPSHIIINIRSFQITLRTTHPTIQPFPRSSVYA